MYVNNAGMATADAPYPATPGQHAALLHPLKAKGRVVLVRKARWKGESWEPWELEDALHGAAGEPDTYMTQSRFVGERRTTEKVAELAALFADVDYREVPELRHLAPESVLEMALSRLRDAGVPEPSLALSSGRGMYLVWPHTPVARKELPAWNACQDRIYRVLRPLGADRRARDAARLLRLAGTVNSKNGATVRPLAGASEERRRFGDLVEALVKNAPAPPVEGEREGADLFSIAVRRAAKGLRTHPLGWSDVTLWEGRLTDLQRLRRMRYGSGTMGDQRDRWLFILTTGISWLVDPEVLDREVLAVAEEVGGWDTRRTRSDLGQIMKRARRAAAGEKIEYEGRLWDPRHHFHNETIIEWLEITPEEEREMAVTISPEEENRRRRARNRAYSERRRRAAGSESRAGYEKKRSTALARKMANARHLQNCGLSTRQIAEAMEVSERSVQRWLR